MSANIADNMQINPIIGASVPRIEGPDKATGRAIYTDDITRPGMLHAALLGSHYAHARILSVDTSAARALPGVKAVLVGTDLPHNYIGMFIKDQLPLARDKVRYSGEPVAAVAAIDLMTARQALRLIEIEYEELEPVTDVEEALKPGAPVIHEQRDEYPTMYELPEEPNAICFTEFMEGDPNTAWDRCDVIVEDEYLVPAQYHMYMEPSSTLAEVDGNGKVTLWTSTQGVARVQMHTAVSLGLPCRKCVSLPRVSAAVSAASVNLPTSHNRAAGAGNGPDGQTDFSREDDMTMMKRRHSGKIYMKTAPQRTVSWLRATAGSYLTAAPTPMKAGSLTGGGIFQPGSLPHPNMRVEAWSCIPTFPAPAPSAASVTRRPLLPVNHSLMIWRTNWGWTAATAPQQRAGTGGQVFLR